MFYLNIFFSVSRRFPSWRWLMGKIIIMLLRSNEKLKSRSEGGTSWKGDTAPKQQTPHHHCMHCILHLCVFTCPLAYNDRLLRSVIFVSASSFSGQGRPQKVTAAVSIRIIKLSSSRKTFKKKNKPCFHLYNVFTSISDPAFVQPRLAATAGIFINQFYQIHTPKL